MNPYNRLIIISNWHRAQALRVFRQQVEAYFERSEGDADGVPLDWEGAQAARSRINQMLPRVLQIVRAAGLGDQAGSPRTTDPGPPLGRTEVLQRIFSARHTDGSAQEIFDVLDMALGVYDGDRIFALGRTINPLHYAGKVLAFVARFPRSVWAALGLDGGSQPPRLRPHDVARLEAAVARLSDIESLIETRFADLQDRQVLRNDEHHRQLVEIAERLDFAERMLVRQQAPKQIEAPEQGRVATPV
jgi:hypothetical protein